MNILEIAYRLMREYEASGKYANLSLSSHIADSLSASERAQLTSLFYTAVENKLRYDYYVSSVSRRPISDIDPDLRDLLRIGVAALLDMRSIPDHAAVNGTVSLARGKGARAFANAVLRSLARTRDSLPMPAKEKNRVKYYSVKYSLPQPTVKYFISLLGEEGAVSFFEAGEEQKGALTLSVNTLRISVEDMLLKLKGAGVNATRARFSPISIRVSESVDPRKLPGFSEGEIFVQDEASALGALTLGAKPGQLICDVCSAPGGKAMLTAVLTSDGADIRAFDLHKSKLSLITGSAQRLGLSSLKVSERDAKTPDRELLFKADRVICDVPCSGLGVMYKKPDLRYKDITDLSELCSLQYEILKASSGYLAPGGVLVYSTCTLRSEENEDIVSRFLSENEGFERVEFSHGELCSRDGMLTLYPHIHGTDGFFICKLRRKDDKDIG